MALSTFVTRMSESRKFGRRFGSSHSIPDSDLLRGTFLPDAFADLRKKSSLRGFLGGKAEDEGKQEIESAFDFCRSGADIV